MVLPPLRIHKLWWMLHMAENSLEKGSSILMENNGNYWDKSGHTVDVWCKTHGFPTGLSHNTANNVMIEENDSKLEEPSNNKTVTVGPSPTPTFTEWLQSFIWTIAEDEFAEYFYRGRSWRESNSCGQRKRRWSHYKFRNRRYFFFFLHSKSIIFIINKGQY